MTAHEMRSFGTLLRRYRLAASLSQEALAERAQLSTATIAALERGRHSHPRPETVVLLAAALALGPVERAALISAATGATTGELVPTTMAPPPSPETARSVPALAAWLPVPPTSLIGRVDELAAVTRLLRQDGGGRLVTLTGLGGVGKTRLALAVAVVLRDTYPDGVAFIDLSALRDPALVAPTIAQTLGLRETGSRAVRDLLLERLHDQRLLLVLDNFEQVALAAPLVAELLTACPHLAVLVTSRVALRLRAEQRFEVPPLAVPDPSHVVVEEVARSTAGQLFVARARAALPDFQLDATNAPAVAEICRRLDGVPLAIELAAARVALLPPTALLGRLARRLEILTEGARDVPKRQRTLRATIDWGYELLREWEQALFRWLSVFQGGCTLDAAETIALPHMAAGDVLAAVETLLDHSLLRNVGQPDGEPRLQMLETIREYGLERLATSGEETEARRIHATYYLTLAEAAKPHLFGPDQVHWLDLLEREHDNLRATLVRVRQAIEQGLRLAGALWRFWYLRCYLSEGRGWLEEFMTLSGHNVAAGSDRIDALVGLAVIAYAQTDYDQAAVAAEEAVAVARVLDDRPNLAVALNILGGVARNRSDFGRAAALGEECVTLARSSGDRWALTLSLSNLAGVNRIQGTYERARALCDESLTLSRALGDRWGVAQALLTLGQIACDCGDAEAAAALCGESLSIVRALGHTRDVALALACLGQVARLQGDSDGATALFEESLASLRPIGDKLRVAEILTALGRARHAQGDNVRAADLYREGLIVFQTVGDKCGLAESLEGLAVAIGQAGLAHDDEVERAVHLLAVAQTLRAAIGAPLAPAERPGYERAVASLREMLGDTRFTAAWTAGQTLSAEQAMAEATRVLADRGAGG